MPQFNDTELTAAVIRSFEKTPDPRVKFLMEELVKSLHAFVRDERERASFAEPRGVFDLILRHRLLDENHAARGEPFDHLQRLVAVVPALVRVDGDWFVGDIADRGHEGVGVVSVDYSEEEVPDDRFVLFRYGNPFARGQDSRRSRGSRWSG